MYEHGHEQIARLDIQRSPEGARDRERQREAEIEAERRAANLLATCEAAAREGSGSESEEAHAAENQGSMLETWRAIYPERPIWWDAATEQMGLGSPREPSRA